MDGTKDPTGPPSANAGATSEGDKGTPTATPKTYSEEEHQAAVEKAKNDALAAAGRTAKQLGDKEATLTSQEQAIKDGQAKLAERQRVLDEAELALVRQDPARLRDYQARKAKELELGEIEKAKEQLRLDKEAFNREKAEHAGTVQAAKDTLLEIGLWKIGTKYNVDPQVLKDLNLSSLEKAEEVAKRIGTRPPMGGAATQTELEPDSGLTSAGMAGQLTPEQFTKLSPEEKKKYLKL
jgi:hypothetical protein